MLLGERLRLRERPRRDPNVIELPYFSERPEMSFRLEAGADDREHVRVLARQLPRRESACRRRPNGGDRRRVHDGDRLARLAVEQRHRALVRIEPAIGVVWDDDDGLEPVHPRVAAAMRGHEPDQRLVARRPDHRPEREMNFAACDRAERALDRGQAAGRVEELLDVRFSKDEDLVQASDLGGSGETVTVPPDHAGGRAAASSVAHVLRSVRGLPASLHHNLQRARRRAPFRQTS